MIFETLQILLEQLEQYYVDTGLGKILVLENIALLDSGSDEEARIKGKVVLSLLKLEEEATLKNSTHYRTEGENTEYHNPPVHLNLFLMISANCETYSKSLRSISKAIEFFQGKKLFTSGNTVYNRDNVSFEVLDYFKFGVELYTPSFEELNHVWGTLGGRQIPSVIYKVQLIQIRREKKLGTSAVITHVGGKLNDISS